MSTESGTEHHTEGSIVERKVVRTKGDNRKGIMGWAKWADWDECIVCCWLASRHSWGASKEHTLALWSTQSHRARFWLPDPRHLLPVFLRACPEPQNPYPLKSLRVSGNRRIPTNQGSGAWSGSMFSKPQKCAFWFNNSPWKNLC